MTIEAPSHIPEIDSSLGTIFDKSTLYMAFFPAGAYVDIIDASDYRGIEWMPNRTYAGIQFNLGLVGGHTKEAITSLHQSFRGEKSLFQALAHPKGGLAVLSYLLLPERVASLDNLTRLQQVVGRQLPVVLYPELRGEESGTERNFAQKMFQPTPEVMRMWGTRTVEQLVVEAKKRGYTGFCVDLAHTRSHSVDAYTLEPWQETLPQMLPFAQEIHVAAGRIDMPYKNTLQELNDLLRGTRHTELPQMLGVIGQSGWRGRIVTEIPAIALHRIHGRAGFLPIRTLVRDHKEIVRNIKALLS